jgi:hypothetical protein
MGLFRIFRPITIEARQCRKAETIATDLGFANIMPGDWLIRGEDGECYSVSDDFFHRTFAPVDEEQLSRKSQGMPDRTHSICGKTHSNQFGCAAGLALQGPRTIRLVHSSRKRRLGMSLVHGRRGPARAARTPLVPSSPHKGTEKVKQSI